jgi:hypothetical protein
VAPAEQLQQQPAKEAAGGDAVEPAVSAADEKLPSAPPEGRPLSGMSDAAAPEGRTLGGSSDAAEEWGGGSSNSDASVASDGALADLVRRAAAEAAAVFFRNQKYNLLSFFFFKCENSAAARLEYEYSYIAHSFAFSLRIPRICASAPPSLFRVKEPPPDKRTTVE